MVEMYLKETQTMPMCTVIIILKRYVFMLQVHVFDSDLQAIFSCPNICLEHLLRIAGWR